MGFVFDSSKDLSCLFTRTDGIAERYTGSIKKYGVDIDFTKEAQMVWLVFASRIIGPGALSGDYGGATASATVGVGAGANVLLGGSNKQITLQPVSVEGSTGLNLSAGIGAVELKYVPRRCAPAGAGRAGQFGSAMPSAADTLIARLQADCTAAEAAERAV